MTNFATADQARQSLSAAGFKAFTKGVAPLSESYLNDYATIAAFLCDQARFTRYLDAVSGVLWSSYRHLRKDEKNKFTKALGAAARDFGFMFQQHLNVETPPNGIVLVTGDEPKFCDYVRTKLFWKDSMDGRHGEHSHSLQWLTIAYAELTANSAADLYANSVNYKCVNKDGKDIFLWSWLVDCFPSDMHKFAPALPPKGAETLESDSFRAPQFLMDYLMVGPVGKLADHFVAQYLYWRYKNRNWLIEKAAKNLETGIETKRVTSIQARDIKSHGLNKHGGAEWTAGKDPASGKVRSFERVQPGGDHTIPVKLEVDATFHNVPGVLSFRYME